MKKFMLCLTGILFALSMTACSPTQKETEPAATEASTGGASDKVPDATAEVLEMVSIYTPNEDNNGLNQMMDGVAVVDADSLLDKLIEYGALEEGTELLSLETEGEAENTAAGPGITEAITTYESAVLDLSAIPDDTDLDKELAVAAVGNTFTENLSIKHLTITVNGETVSEDFSFRSDYQTLITD